MVRTTDLLQRSCVFPSALAVPLCHDILSAFPEPEPSKKKACQRGNRDYCSDCIMISKRLGFKLEVIVSTLEFAKLKFP